jgi:hypothetical protein
VVVEKTANEKANLFYGLSIGLATVAEATGAKAAFVQGSAGAIRLPATANAWNFDQERIYTLH